MMRRFRLVPIGVSMPPNCAENVIGISVFDADVPARIATLIRIGIIMTTCGVLFMNALMSAVEASIPNMAPIGLTFHNAAVHRPIGTSAPVRTRP
jgi:hypothetical protein